MQFASPFLLDFCYLVFTFTDVNTVHILQLFDSQMFNTDTVLSVSRI
jgi:hypothetical protein